MSTPPMETQISPSAPLQVLFLQLLHLAVNISKGASGPNPQIPDFFLGSQERLRHLQDKIIEKFEEQASMTSKLNRKSEDTIVSRFDKLEDLVNGRSDAYDKLSQENEELRNTLVSERVLHLQLKGINEELNKTLQTERTLRLLLSGEKEELSKALETKQLKLEEALANKSRSDLDDKTRETLLQLGVDPATKDGNGYTPLHWAAWHGRHLAAAALIRAGANLEAKDKENQTPLHWAAYGPSPNAIKTLVDGGAAVNVLDHWRWTPLHWAVYHDRVEAARILLALGADTNAVGHVGTPVQVARHYNKFNVLHVLLSHP